MSSPGGDGDFERWLEQELRHTVAPQRGPKPRASQARYRRSPVRRGSVLAIKSAVIAAVGAKTATGLVVVALAVGGGGAIVATKTTHSSNPAVWTRHVVDAVQGVSPSATPGGLGHPDAGVITGPTPAPTPGAGVSPVNGQTTAPGQTGAAPGQSPGAEPPGQTKPKKPKKKDATPTPTATSDGYADPTATDSPKKPNKGTPPPGQ